MLVKEIEILMTMFRQSVGTSRCFNGRSSGTDSETQYPSGLEDFIRAALAQLRRLTVNTLAQPLHAFGQFQDDLRAHKSTCSES
jgi:hypothetical protein